MTSSAEKLNLRAESDSEYQSKSLPERFIEFPFELDNSALPFLAHMGQGRLDNAVALNVVFDPIHNLRKQIEAILGRKLEIFRGWNPEGEAHVTVITPPVYSDVLSKFLTIEEINQMAIASKIQESDLVSLGLGSGRKVISGVEEEVFFVIVESSRLRNIRVKIWHAYVAKGGRPKDWDPAWFFPHVTIGFTKQDIHEPDVLKNIKHSFDARFHLIFIR